MSVMDNAIRVLKDQGWAKEDYIQLSEQKQIEGFCLLGAVAYGETSRSFEKTIAWDVYEGEKVDVLQKIMGRNLGQFWETVEGQRALMALMKAIHVVDPEYFSVCRCQSENLAKGLEDPVEAHWHIWKLINGVYGWVFCLDEGALIEEIGDWNDAQMNTDKVIEVLKEAEIYFGEYMGDQDA